MTKIRRGPLGLGLLVAVALVAGGCVASPGAGPASPNETLVLSPSENAPAPASLEPLPSIPQMSAGEFWAELVPGDPGAITYASLQAIVKDASAVVVASLGELERGPTYADEYGNVIYFGALTLKVQRVLYGDVTTKNPGTAKVLILLGVGDATYAFEDRLASLQAAIPVERGIFFLVNMVDWVARTGGDASRPEADPYSYEVLGGQGFLRDVGGKVQPPLWSTSGWPQSLRGRVFDEVVAQIAAIVASTR